MSARSSVSEDSRHLLFVGVTALASIALAYDYVTSTGETTTFLAMLGAGAVLAGLVALPVLADTSTD
jgi:hypothetical protein